MEEVTAFTAAFRLDDLITIHADKQPEHSYMVSRSTLYAASAWFRKTLSQRSGSASSSAASNPFAGLFASDTASKAAVAAAMGSSGGES